MNYLWLLLGLGIVTGSFYFSMLRPMRGIDFRSNNRCDARGRYNTDLTYQDTCPTNRSTNRIYYGPTVRGFSGGGLGTTPRRNAATIRGFRGGGPGAGK